MKIFFERVKSFSISHRYLLLAAVVAAGAGVFLMLFAAADQLQWGTQVQHLGLRNERKLDGRLVDAADTHYKPLAIMLENHADSRPIAGLEQASIVYESIVEGDITRFLAIFDGAITAKKIGPVRSARPFFVELAQQWDPLYFHAGGSQQALDMLARSTMYNVNEISGDGIYFWRDPARSAPHNLFTSANQMRRAMVAKDIASTTVAFSPWLFKSDAGTANPTYAVIEVNFSGNPLYQVRYEYSTDGNIYSRFLNNKLHKTENGIILKANNIIVQHVTADIIDDYGRLEVDVASGGTADIYRDGGRVEGSWKVVAGQTRYFDAHGEEIAFNRGTTWIELVFE